MLLWSLFGTSQPGLAAGAGKSVTLVHGHIRFDTTKAPRLNRSRSIGTQVCRDFMHLAITFAGTAIFPLLHRIPGDTASHLAAAAMDFAACSKPILWPMRLDARNNVSPDFNASSYAAAMPRTSQ